MTLLHRSLRLQSGCTQAPLSPLPPPSLAVDSSTRALLPLEALQPSPSHLLPEGGTARRKHVAGRDWLVGPHDNDMTLK